MKKITLLLLLMFIVSTKAIFAQCGLDVYIANDQSGSVDATENAQSRDFITQLAQLRTLGNLNTQNRIAVADWAETGTFTMFTFPSAGRNYTTKMTDVIAYKNAKRVLNGGTDPYEALQKSYSNINKTQVTGRTVGKVLVLMTDASPNQVQSNVITMATTIKQAGVTIIVMAVGPAASITTLQGTNVASDPSLYFSAADYQTLVDNAITTVGGMLANSCGQTSTPTYDLTVKLNSANCGTVGYTVSNPWRANFTGILSTSFYDGNPALPTSKLLATDRRSGQTIAANGGSQTYSFTSPILSDKVKLWAVVNLDTTGVKAITQLPTDLTGRLLLTAEQNPYNNVSDSVLSVGCVATSPRLEVEVQKLTVSCDKQVTYAVNICNTGGANAAEINTQLVPANSNFVLKSADGPVSTTGVASFTMPNNNTTTSGYRSYGISQFPCGVSSTGDACNFNLQYLPSSGFFTAYGGFTFPPTSPGSGIPAGATIINATFRAFIVTGSVYGAKLTDAGRFSAARTVPYVIEHFRSAASVSFVDTSTQFVPLNVTAIAQELVNQPGWTSSSAMSFLWQGLRVVFDDSTLNSPTTIPTLTVTYTNPTLPSGTCATYTYVYDASAAPAGTYDVSANVSTSTPGAIYLPNTNFTTNGNPGLNGYNGATNTGDEVVIPASTGCAQAPQPISTSVSITPGSTCGGPGNYVTATVTINNPNTQPTPGITLRNLVETLNLYGTGAKFTGEPYNLTNGLQMAQPNTLDSLYPANNYAISNTSGARSLVINQLPPGTSTFKIDLIPGTAAFNLTATVSQIPIIYNSEAGTSGRNPTNITITSPPTITWNCPGSIAAGSTVNLSASVTGAANVTLTSATSGNITNTGTVAAPAATYTPTPQDIANRYAALNIYAATSGGCDAGFNCTVPITGATYDYGDAPASYDLDSNVVGTAAGSTIRSGLNLGFLAPSTENTTHASAAADGDGTEEDGLVSLLPIFSGTSTATYQVRVTNNTASAAYLAGFADFNADGNLLDSNEVSNVITIPANSGVAVYNLVFSKVPSTGIINYFMRLRLSTSAITVAIPYGASPEGEVEDYKLAFTFPLPVGLSAFAVAQQQCEVIASWEATNTAAITRFGLERSADGQQYKETGSLKPSDGKTSYSLKDKPGSGGWYYRLKMVGTDGTVDYSNSVLTTVSCGEEDIRVYPTATADMVQISLPKTYDQASISVIDGMGNMVAVPVIGSGMNRQVQLGILPSGLYLIRIKDSKEVRTFKVTRL